MSIDDFVKVVTVVSPIILAAIVYFTGRQAHESAQDAKAEVKTVQETLATTSTETATKLDSIHVLVNSRLTEALAKIARLEERQYLETGELPTGEPPAGHTVT